MEQLQLLGGEDLLISDFGDVELFELILILLFF